MKYNLNLESMNFSGFRNKSFAIDLGNNNTLVSDQDGVLVAQPLAQMHAANNIPGVNRVMLMRQRPGSGTPDILRSIANRGAVPALPAAGMLEGLIQPALQKIVGATSGPTPKCRQRVA